MQLRALVPAMAAMAAIPAAQAFEVAGDGWNLSIEPRLQTHIEFASASDAAGDDKDIWDTTATGDDVQTWNFNVRRARIYTKGKSDDGYFFGLTINADKIGWDDGADKDSMGIEDAFIGKAFSGANSSHKLQFGLDQLADGGPVVIADTSSSYLFPNIRLSVAEGNLGVGFIYRMKSEVFGFSAALGESVTKQSAVDDDSDLYFAARVFSSLSADMALAKRAGSFLGKESGGLKHEAGLSLEYKMDAGDETIMVIGLDYLMHLEQWTVLAEFYMRSEDTADRDGMSFLAQAGYAIPLQSGKVAEPALRVTYLDNDTDADTSGSMSGEGGDDGLYIDLGVNYYLNGHDNKLQAGVQIYTPEEGDGDAFVLRLAHCIEF